ncbi:MAG TPA: hypothetical protein VF190_08985 [Rhodothermales bacterium]
MLRLLKYSASVALLLAITLVGVGCDSGGDDDEPSLTGRWVANTTFQGVNLIIDLQLTQNGGNVSANGTVRLVNIVAISGNGTYNHPSVALTLTSTGLEDMNFTGSVVSGNQEISGTLNGSGFENFSVSLRRQ